MNRERSLIFVLRVQTLPLAPLSLPSHLYITPYFKLVFCSVFQTSLLKTLFDEHARRILTTTAFVISHIHAHSKGHRQKVFTVWCEHTTTKQSTSHTICISRVDRFHDFSSILRSLFSLRDVIFWCRISQKSECGR